MNTQTLFPLNNRILLIILLILTGCSTPGTIISSSSSVARGGEYVILTAGPADTLQSLATRYLGNKDKAWIIGDFNKTGRIIAGQEIIIPLVHPNPTGVYPNGYQTVPILTYHRFGSKSSKMTITAETFTTQLAYLRDKGYRVIPLTALPAFLRGEVPLPQRAIIITIDDGYKSMYNIAFPILKRFDFPATVFLYSDFVDATDALNWNEMEQMIASGLIDIQPHSKTHDYLTVRRNGESLEAYKKRLMDEIRMPGQQIRDRLGLPLHSFAYPYGETNTQFISELKSFNYQLGTTVWSGGNPAFGYPFRLKRTMIYGNSSMESFIANLQVFNDMSLK